MATLKSGAPTKLAGRIANADILLATLFDQFGDETSPTGLMAGTDSCAVVAMKVFVEKDEVAPVRIALKGLGGAGYGPAPA